MITFARPQLNRSTWPVTFAILCSLAFSTSCSSGQGEDSWAHYQGGGSFASGDPSFSGDGKTLYYSTPKTGQGDIWAHDLTNGSETRLTATPECDLGPLALPKSARILFSRESNGLRHIWSMAPDGSDQKQITSGDYLDDLAEVSRDEKQVLLIRSELSYGLGRLAKYYLLSLAKSNADPVEVGSSATLSSSGEQVVFNPSDSNEIWIWKLSDGTKTKVGKGYPCQMSADEQYVVAFRELAVNPQWGHYDIVLIDLQTGKEKTLVRGSGPQFSSDGSGIVFGVLRNDYRQELHYISLDGSKRKKINIPDYDTQPVFSPDGKRLVVTNVPNGPVGGSQKPSHVAYLIDTTNWKYETIGLDGASP